MKLVLVNGCFDLLHTGHLKLLEFAKKQGDFLVVAIDTDNRVRELKGSSRPINNLQDRMEMLSAIRWVDWVTFFDSEDDLKSLIKQYKPQIMVKGDDYKGKPIVGEELVPEIIFMERTDKSSTQTIKGIAGRGSLY